MTPRRVIGKDNELPWRLSADLKHFKAITMGKPIVMGRKTFESIGRALPGRKNIVLTREMAFQAAGVEVAHSLDAAIGSAGATDEIMIIGGAQLYALALPRAHRLYVTWVVADIDGDTFFPETDWSQWRMTQRSAHQSSAGLRFYFCVYDRSDVNLTMGLNPPQNMR